MRKARFGVLLALIGIAATTTQAGAGWSVGVRLGIPAPAPYYRPVYGYYRPVPVYYAPPPPAVIVQPAPVAAVVAGSPPAEVPVAPPPPPAPNYSAAPVAEAPANVTPVARTAPADSLSELNSPDDRVRARAAVEVGRRRDRRAVGALIKVLRDDASPLAREAAARGLGLLAEPSSLATLQHAAQADEDREVRHSAAFAADVIRGQMPRR